MNEYLQELIDAEMYEGAEIVNEYNKTNNHEKSK
jgi:hypothetical protein